MTVRRRHILAVNRSFSAIYLWVTGPQAEATMLLITLNEQCVLFRQTQCAKSDRARLSWQFDAGMTQELPCAACAALGSAGGGSNFV